MKFSACQRLMKKLLVRINLLTSAVKKFRRLRMSFRRRLRVKEQSRKNQKMDGPRS